MIVAEEMQNAVNQKFGKPEAETCFGFPPFAIGRVRRNDHIPQQTGRDEANSPSRMGKAMTLVGPVRSR